MARWCNQISFFKKKSFKEFAEADQKYYKSKCSAVKSVELIERDFPEIAAEYFDLRFEDVRIDKV